MSDERFNEMFAKTEAAWQESTGEAPQPPEVGEIQAVVRDYLASEKQD